LVFGNVDIKTTKQQEKKLKRKLADELRLFKCETITNAEALQSHPDCSLEDDCNDVMSGDLDEASIEGDSIENVDFMPESPKLPTSSSQEVLNYQMRTPLPTLARECDRWGVSDRIGCFG